MLTGDEGLTFGGLVRRYRERARLTQRQLAQQAGLSVRAIGKIELDGVRSPRWSTVELLAGALGLDGATRDRLEAAARGDGGGSAGRDGVGLHAGPVEAGVPTPGGVAAPAAVPAQLPADVRGFVGRERELEWLDRALAEAAREPTAVVVAVLSGAAGVGKTALAVHWAHRVRERFPDGQLYSDLHGFAAGPPSSPSRTLAQLLRGLGVEADAIPAEVERNSALFRSLLAGKRMLLVLDDARSADQVRPLLPGGPGCLVVVTSRDRLAGLVASHGAQRLDLDVLTGEEAAELLARILGAERVAAEPAAAGELARVCGHLPLALRIAAANLAAHPRWRIHGYAARLRRGDPLSDLVVDDDLAVRAAFDASYGALGRDERRLFRLLGLVPGPEVGAPAAAALAGTGVDRAERLLERLAAAHLLEQREADRFAFHDLLRIYASRRAASEEPEPQRRAAFERLLAWYLRGADAATRLLYPQLVRLPVPDDRPPSPPVAFDDQPAALAWLDREQANLVAAVVGAARGGPPRMAWLLTDALRGYLWFRRSSADWLTVADAGLAAATAGGDPRAQAAMRFVFGDALDALGRYPEAIEHLTAALKLARQAGWSDGEGIALGNLGSLYHDTGSLQLAADHHAQALALYRRSGRRASQATCLGSLGIVYRMMGRLREAADHVTDAMALYRESGSRTGEANCLAHLADIRIGLGEPDRAQEHASNALALHRLAGDRYGEAFDRNLLAAAARDTGRLGEAVELAEAALALAREIGERRAQAEALNTLGSLHLRARNHQRAIDAHRQALALARGSGIRYVETEALLGLAVAHHAARQRELGAQTAERALEIARQAGFRFLETRAAAVLAAPEGDRQGPSGGRVATWV